MLRGVIIIDTVTIIVVKVCLSILGTWAGPSWSPALSLSSLLISIQAFFMNENYALTSFHLQSLMTDKPYHNEPGYENERFGGDVKRFVPEWCVPALTDISFITGTI